MNEISIVHRREYNCESKCKVHSPIETQQDFSLSVNNFSEPTEVFPLLQLSVPCLQVTAVNRHVCECYLSCDDVHLINLVYILLLIIIHSASK